MKIISDHFFIMRFRANEKRSHARSLTHDCNAHGLAALADEVGPHAMAPVPT